jgi:hypothetical protein
LTKYDGSTNTTNANEPQHEEVTEEEKRRWDEEEEEKRRWDEEEDEERRSEQTNKEHDEGKAETDNVVKNLAKCNTDRQEPTLPDSLVNESLAQEQMTPDLFPLDIKNIIAKLRIIVDHIDSPRKQAQDLIHELARLLDEKGLCERYNISKKIKEILKDKVHAGKVTGRWIESCLPPEYKRTYVKSELSSLSTSKRKRPDSVSTEPALVPPIQVHESGRSIQQQRESDDTNSDNYTVTNHKDNQSGFDDNSKEGTTKVKSKEAIVSSIKKNKNLTEKKVLVSCISMPFKDLQKDMEAVFRITNGIGEIFFKVSFDLESHIAEIEFCGITKQKGIDMTSNGIGRILKEA